MVKVRVKYGGASDGLEDEMYMDVTATLVNQSMELVFPNRSGAVDQINFETIYEGEKRKIPALLVNNGPNPISFTLALTDDVSFAAFWIG